MCVCEIGPSRPDERLDDQRPYATRMTQGHAPPPLRKNRIRHRIFGH